MQFIRDFIQRIQAAATARERAAQEAFLAGADDIYQVEARMREWDRRQSTNPNQFPALTGLQLH